MPDNFTHQGGGGASCALNNGGGECSTRGIQCLYLIIGKIVCLTYNKVLYINCHVIETCHELKHQLFQY